MNGKVIMGAGITGAVLVVAVGALLIRPWQGPPKPPNVLTDNAAEQATHILAQPTFAGALAYARPAVVDGGPGFGQVLLAVWAVDRLRWADIEVDVPETSLPLFKKDPDAERGKRLCADVWVLNIAAESSGVTKRYSGLMISRAAGNVPYHFTAVRSTGAIVERSNARFCGYAIAFDRYKSNDGPREGLQVLGMFDLPENRQ